MHFIARQRETSVFLALTSLIALTIVLSPGADNDWMLDPLTGVVTAVTGLVVCARLALGSTSRPVRQLWQAILLMLALVCISHLADSFSDRVQEFLGIDVDDWLMLSAAPLFLWLSARFEPVPTVVRRVLWLALAFQLAAMGAELYGDHYSAPWDGNFWSLVTDVADFVSMQCYLLAAALFVAALRVQILAANRGPLNVGDLARYLFVTHRLFRQQRYPRNESLSWIGGKMMLGLGRFFVWFFSVGPRVRDELRIGLWQQVVQIGVIWFRHGLDAQAYYMFELYRRRAAVRAAGFLTRYETKNGLFKELTRQVRKGGRRNLLGDKLEVARICSANGIPHVPVLMAAENGAVTVQCEPAALKQDLFVKPRQLKGARNTEMLRYVDGIHIGHAGAQLALADVLDHVAARSRDAALLVQPRIRNHPDLADLATDSLVVARIITCRDGDNQPVATHGMLRVLSKLEPTWSTDIELGAPIDLRRGTLGRMTGDKADMALDWFEDHPITGAPVLGRRVPHWDDVRAVAIAAHRVYPDRLLIGWDIAISPEGALLVEGNSYADVDFLQRVARQPIGDSPLGPLLYDQLTHLERRLVEGRRTW